MCPAAGDLTDFQDNSDYISFNFSPPSSAAPAEAGPSRHGLPINPITGATAVIPSGARSSNLSRSDERLLSAKNGRRTESAEELAGTAKGKGKGKAKGKGKLNGAGPSSSQGTPNVNGSGSKGNLGKRPREDETGPRNRKEEKKAAERAAPWADAVDWRSCRDAAEMLNAEIEAYHRYVSPTRAEFEVRLFIIELITRTIAKLWPDAEITPFGSWQTQLYLPQGDIDLVISKRHSHLVNKGKLLAELGRALRSARITDVVAIIANARVPIIKFVTLEGIVAHLLGKLNVDISLNQTNGISAGKIINQYLDVLPGARQLIMVVKAFLSQRSMNEVFTGGLGSYSVICMVISFLQIHPKLRRAEIDPEKNLGTLLIEFLELYGRNFHYEAVGLSIRRGGFYFSKGSKRWANGPARHPFLLSIEDPQDPDNDISVGSYGIRQVKSSLSGAYEMLQERLFERAEQIAGWRTGRFSDNISPEDMSILAGVMGITKETQKQRVEIQKLHNEGRLQRLLGIPAGTVELSDYVQNYRSPLMSHTKNGDLDAQADDVSDRANKRRKSDSALGAILVDDEDDGDDGEDFQVDDSDMEMEMEGEEEFADEFEEEDDEIFPVEIPLPGINGQALSTKRNQSVSEDEIDLDEEGLLNDIIEVMDDSEDESRYAAVGRAIPRRKPTNGKAETAGFSDSEDERSSSSGIQAISPPPPKRSLENQSNDEKATRGMKRKEREAYWAAKGKLDKEEDIEDDEIDGNADFVSFGEL